MTVRIDCPHGHPVHVEECRLGGMVACPHCLATFRAETKQDRSPHARPEKGKARRDDEEDDDDEEDEKPVKKKAKKAAAKDDDEEEDEDEKPVKKKAKKAAAKDEDDEDDEKPRSKKSSARDDDEEDEEEEDEDDEEPIKWTTKKRQMQVLSNAMMMYLVAFYTMVVMFVLDGLATVFVVIMGAIAMFSTWGAEGAAASSAFDTLKFIQFIALIALSPFLLVIYVTMFIAWVMGLFAPAKSEVRTISIVAMILFLFPVFLYIVFFIFYATIVTREEVGARLLNMFHGFAFLCNMGSLYCSLVYIGRVAAYLGRTTDKNKPMALGWFIVGGFIARVAATGVLAFLIIGVGMVGIIPFGIIKAMCLFILNTYYFVINSIRELVEVVNNIRADIHMKIRDE